MANKIDDLLSLVPADYSVRDEKQFKEAWRLEAAPGRTPLEQAFRGGMLTDNLAFLFIAGYQAAIRHCFGVEGGQWSAFAVSEDQSEENPLPGLSLTTNSQDDTGTLNGYKTWVAACNSIDEIIVTATDVEHTTHLFRIERDQAGIEIIPRPVKPSFLGDMSQGTAHFSNVQVSRNDQPDAGRLKAFASTEPLYLYLSFAGFLHSRSPETAIETILADLIALADQDLRLPEARDLFANVDSRMQALMTALPDIVFSGQVGQDRALIGLYSKAIQKRAGKT